MKTRIIFFILSLSIILFSCSNTPAEKFQEENTKITAPVDGNLSKEIEESTKEFIIHGSTFKLTPKEIRVKKGDRVKIIYYSDDIGHDLVIDEYMVRTDVLTKGGVDIIEFTADKEGTFIMYCSVGSHKSLGMEGKLIVE